MAPVPVAGVGCRGEAYLMVYRRCVWCGLEQESEGLRLDWHDINRDVVKDRAEYSICRAQKRHIWIKKEGRGK